MNFNNHGVARAVTAAGAAVRLIAVFLIAALIVSPQLAAAQAAPGQPITSQSLALTATGLGPGLVDRPPVHTQRLVPGRVYKRFWSRCANHNRGCANH